MKFAKYQLSTDVFSMETMAASRSVDLGMDGATHGYDVDGQAMYMPGATHEEYLQTMGYEDYDEPNEDRMVEAIRAVVRAIMEKNETPVNIVKIDEEHRIIYGWASVTTNKGEYVVDRQGDVIKTETLHKAVNEFMKGVRVGKLMHMGEQVGQIVHSFPITKEICSALGIQSDKEGWITGYFVEDDNLWADVKSGKYASFSIGGRAIKEEYIAD